MANLIRLNLELVRRLISGRSITQLLARWPVATDPSRGRIPPPDKATISRWVNGVTFPRSRDELFGLAGALDVDPLALLSLLWPELCAAVLAYFWDPRLAPAVQRYSFLGDLILPDPEWPSAHVADKYFGRRWNRFERKHIAAVRRNYYAAFVIEPDPEAKFQVWHFAWRKNQAAPWISYGFVRLEDDLIRICGFDGREATAARSASERFSVETWFGHDAAEFCVASLHGFTCLPEGDAKFGGVPVVRFRKALIHLPVTSRSSIK